MMRNRLHLLAVAAALAAAPCAAEVLPPTPEVAIGLIASASIYQERCLHGRPLSPQVIQVLQAYLDASGLDQDSPRVGGLIQVEKFRQVAQVLENGGDFCKVRLESGPK